MPSNNQIAAAVRRSTIAPQVLLRLRFNLLLLRTPPWLVLRSSWRRAGLDSWPTCGSIKGPWRRATRSLMLAPARKSRFPVSLECTVMMWGYWIHWSWWNLCHFWRGMLLRRYFHGRIYQLFHGRYRIRICVAIYQLILLLDEHVCARTGYLTVYQIERPWNPKFLACFESLPEGRSYIQSSHRSWEQRGPASTCPAFFNIRLTTASYLDHYFWHGRISPGNLCWTHAERV